MLFPGQHTSFSRAFGSQELLRHKNIRTTVRYTHVGYEQTRQTAEALSQIR